MRNTCLEFPVCVGRKSNVLITIIVIMSVLLSVTIFMADRYISFDAKSETFNEERSLNYAFEAVQLTSEENNTTERIVYEEGNLPEVVVKSEFKVIDGQDVYIAVESKQVDHWRYPIVIYSHGSEFTVSPNPSNSLTETLHFWADIFVKGGYVFGASNQHGENWGSDQAIEDTRQLIQYIQQNYAGSNDVYLLAYSMGGLVTMNYAERYPENVKKIALFAPTVYTDNWNAKRVERIMNIPIKVWHGKKDVNVPYYLLVGFINRLQYFGKEIDVVDLPDTDHGNVQYDYMEDVLDFFNNRDIYFY